MQTQSFNLNALKTRADLYKKIRNFFEDRNVMEIETPLMTPYTVTDPHIHSIKLNFQDRNWFLQTSPEYMMKQLIALGAGDVFQICKAFRADDFGQHHQPEFAMLEWYRMGFDYQTLMQEVIALMRVVFDPLQVMYYAYADLFEDVVGVNPLTTSCEVLEEIACLHLVDHMQFDFSEFTLTDWQQYLFSTLVEPVLAEVPCAMVYDFPISHASLAKPTEHDGRVVERFEMFLYGVECANGYGELTDEAACLNRFNADLQRRKGLGLETVAVDEPFLTAMRSGLPKCAGVSVGLDRVIMAVLKADQISEVVPRQIDFCDASREEPILAIAS